MILFKIFNLKFVLLCCLAHHQFSVLFKSCHILVYMHLMLTCTSIFTLPWWAPCFHIKYVKCHLHELVHQNFSVFSTTQRTRESTILQNLVCFWISHFQIFFVYMNVTHVSYSFDDFDWNTMTKTALQDTLPILCSLKIYESIHITIFPGCASSVFMELF